MSFAPATASTTLYTASAATERCVFGGGYWAPGSYANIGVCDRTGGDLDGTAPTSPAFSTRESQWCITVYKSSVPTSYHSGCATTASSAMTSSATAFVFDPLLEHATVQFSVNSGGGILTANLSLTALGPRRLSYAAGPGGSVEDSPLVDQGIYEQADVRRQMSIDAGSFITSTLATGGIITSGVSEIELRINSSAFAELGP